MDFPPRTPRRARARLLAGVDAEFAHGKTTAFWGDLVELERIAMRDPVFVWPLVERWAGSSKPKVQKCAEHFMECVLSRHWKRYLPRAAQLAAKDPAFATNFAAWLREASSASPAERADIARLRRRFRRDLVKRPLAPPTITDILGDKDSFMDRLFDRVSSRKRRTRAENVAYWLHLLHVLVPGDGLKGYMGNVERTDIVGGVTALRTVGLSGPADLLNRAILIVGRKALVG